MFKKIEEALEWIMSRRNEANDFTHFQKVMEALDNPQDDFKTIHVAGTNGKGSTTTFLRDLLMSQGFKVGSLQSPHYRTHLDRIRINGEMIPADTFLSILNEYYDFFMKEDLNMFEMDFCIMCEYFKKEKVDYAVIEVGLGGRLDSTNVLHHPLLSIITTIGYDHMDRLGEHLEEITKEKCGILKEGGNILTGHLSESCHKVVEECAREKRNHLYTLSDIKETGSRRFLYREEEYAIRSFAHYQIHNAALALEAFSILSQIEGFVVEQDKAKEALASSVWSGRFECIHEHPLVILDGAHNIDGILALVESLDQIPLKKAMLFGALKRKEYHKMIDAIKGHVDTLVLTGFDHPLSSDFMDVEGDVEKRKDFKEAFLELAEGYECIVVAGSLYFISDFVAVQEDLFEKAFGTNGKGNSVK